MPAETDLRSTKDPAALGALVRELRRRMGLSLSLSTIKNIERGQHRATEATRMALAQVLQPAWEDDGPHSPGRGNC